MSIFSNTWKYFFGESCSRPTQNVDLESKTDLDTNLLSNDSSIDHPVIQRKVLFIDILDDEADHKEEIKVEQQEIVEHKEEIKVEQQEIVEHKEEIKVEQEEIKVEQEEIVEHKEEIKVEQVEIVVEQVEQPIVEPIVVEPIVEHKEEIKVEPIVVEPIVEQQDLSLLPKTAEECAILNQNLPENWRPFPMSNILQ
uniref:Uncharacterized protein n=1 Tax=viral metagenome TaxID=1070528 RepID=A0A6C0HWQ5_9ZZZZ